MGNIIKFGDKLMISDIDDDKGCLEITNDEYGDFRYVEISDSTLGTLNIPDSVESLSVINTDIYSYLGVGKNTVVTARGSSIKELSAL